VYRQYTCIAVAAAQLQFKGVRDRGHGKKTLCLATPKIKSALDDEMQVPAASGRPDASAISSALQRYSSRINRYSNSAVNVRNACCIAGIQHPIHLCGIGRISTLNGPTCQSDERLLSNCKPDVAAPFVMPGHRPAYDTQKNVRMPAAAM
jgi:hypothetical protein